MHNQSGMFIALVNFNQPECARIFHVPHLSVLADISGDPCSASSLSQLVSLVH